MPPIWLDMASETAIDYNDPILTTRQAGQLKGIVLERLAAEAEGPVKGTGFTRLELAAYFGRQATLQDYAQ